MPFVPVLFRLNFPGGDVPAFHVLSAAERAELNQRAGRRLGWDDSDEWLRVPWVLFDQSAAVFGDGAAGALDWHGIAAHLGLRPAAWVVVDWFGGDPVRFRWVDVCTCWADLWAEGEDDVAVFDESFDWMLYATRCGKIHACLL